MSAWIFLRGLTRGSRHWNDFATKFADRVPGAEVVALDLPGNGRFHRLPSPARVEEMAEWCRTTLAAEGIRPPYRLLALSLGAMVAVSWAKAHPEEVRGCVLINTSSRPSPFYRRLRPANYFLFLKLTLLGAGDWEWERAILRITSKRPSAQEVLSDWVAARREQRVSPVNTLRQLLAAWRYQAPTARPEPRMLILASRGDALVNADCSRQLAKRWQADFAEHPWAGHDIPLDDGAWVAEQVAAWLTAADQPGAGE